MVEQRAGVIDPYEPSIHKDAARLIEPRLLSYTTQTAAQRRRLVGIIPDVGLDWIFVNVDQLPIETAPPDGKDLFIGKRYEAHPGTYSYNNGIYMANDAEGHFFIACLGRPDRIIPNIDQTLRVRGFNRRSGGVPFPSSDGTAVQVALLNGIADGLGKDCFPFIPNARNFGFYSDKYGEVFADNRPTKEPIRFLDLTPAPK